MSVEEAVEQLDIGRIGDWKIVDDDPTDQLRWHCQTGEIVALPPTDEAEATVELLAPIAGEIERGTVWRRREEWLDALRYTVDWMRDHPYGTPVEDPDIRRDIGEWEFDSAVYIHVEDRETLQPWWRWRCPREDWSDIRAVVRPEDDGDEHEMRIIDDRENEAQVVFTGEPKAVAEKTVEWMEEYDEGVTLEHESIAFGSRDEANRWRDELPEYVRSGRRDRRYKTMDVYPEMIDEMVYSDMCSQAMDSRADSVVTFHQLPLTRGEEKRVRDMGDYEPGRDRLKARMVKGVAAEIGVRDWTARFEPNLTPEEHIGKFRNVAKGMSNETHFDEHGIVPRNARDGQSMRRSFAKKKCKQGVVEACEELVEYHDVDALKLVVWAEKNEELDEVIDEVLPPERVEELRDEAKEMLDSPEDIE